ncbi:response regulator [Nocardioides sp. MAH-18]|uniref:Response regulator n=1 Tax=Nocardioides agri TaxID=2682843 RepID=A0A6L6XQS4_9ACTN|nr:MULTISPECIES: response regulator transcription factor [unclassified Nocardioides]MBA2954063.1 response regulator transcription factor [Nocardioides sp. CGMCC 1.13656]MVQ48926.1 response regulator [Nocardioides sp. MAH-18]
MRVLVVEDDPALSASLLHSFEFEGFSAAAARSAEDAWDALRTDVFDVTVVDVGLPGVSGLELVRRMRREGNGLPVLLLTARHGLGDRVAGLDAGADDYLPKPFDLEELLARLRALVRRSTSPTDAEVYVMGDLTLDARTHDVVRSGRPVHLTHMEFQMLRFFMRHPRVVLSREQLWRNVWGYDFVPASNNLEVFISALRRKTEAGGAPRLVHTVRGAGYVLKDAGS